MSDSVEQAEFGHALESSAIEKGFRELCPDLNFDLATRIGQVHPYINDRQGVFYREKHLCSMDRGIVPEFKVWETKKRITEIPWHEADREDASISYKEVMPTEPGYEDLYERAKKGSDPEYMIKDNGKLLRLRCLGYAPVSRRVLRLGWRHTFERILKENIPGVTRATVSAKFGVDMLKYPVGTPEELVAALVEE